MSLPVRGIAAEWRKEMKKAINIVWDNEVEEGNYGYAELPGSVEIPDGIADDDIADFLSDKYGWCVFSYSLEKDEPEQSKEAPRKWYWKLLNIRGDVLGEGSGYEAKEDAEAAAMDFIKKEGRTDFEYYVLDVNHSTAKGRLFSASVRCPKCGKSLFMRVSDNRDYTYQCIYCNEDFYSFECPQTVSGYQNEHGKVTPLYEIMLHSQADWFKSHKVALKDLCAKYSATFLGFDSDNSTIEFGWEAQYPQEAPDAMTIQLFTDEVLELLTEQKTSPETASKKDREMTIEAMKEYIAGELEAEWEQMLRNEPNHYEYLFRIANDMGLVPE